VLGAAAERQVREERAVQRAVEVHLERVQLVVGVAVGAGDAEAVGGAVAAWPGIWAPAWVGAVGVAGIS
jgi:hypothetical protein